ncbi:MAG: hypothetical protein J5745_02615 [Bacteroidales bacterium]|nr:hypothetical protein [Bacteroidales bacterium]
MAVINAEINYLCHMKWLHNLLKGFSLTGALFVFQACYGTMDAPLYEEGGIAPMSFSVVSHQTGEPLQGIKIYTKPWDRYSQLEEVGVTGEDGRCRVKLYYRRNLEGPVVSFQDPEAHFTVKDTTLADLQDREIVIKLDPIQ